MEKGRKETGEKQEEKQEKEGQTVLRKKGSE